MKNYILFTILLLCLNNLSLFGQSKPDENLKEEKPSEPSFVIVENMPEFMGGENEMFKFIKDNIHLPKIDKKLKGQTMTTFVTFVISATGEVEPESVKTLKSCGQQALDQEAVRMVKSMPRWTPGSQKGTPVAVQFNLPIRYSF